MNDWRTMEWKPCPFCGGEALTVEDVAPARWAVICNACTAMGPTLHWPASDIPEEQDWSLNRTAEEAIEAWNTRA